MKRSTAPASLFLSENSVMTEISDMSDNLSSRRLADKKFRGMGTI
jgi:hypothetical protein